MPKMPRGAQTMIHWVILIMTSFRDWKKSRMGFIWFGGNWVMAMPNMRLNTRSPRSWPSAPALTILGGSIRLKMDVQSFAWSWRLAANLSLSVLEVWAGALSNTSRSSAFGLPSFRPGWIVFTISSPSTTALSVLMR